MIEPECQRVYEVSRQSQALPVISVCGSRAILAMFLALVLLFLANTVVISVKEGHPWAFIDRHSVVYFATHLECLRVGRKVSSKPFYMTMVFSPRISKEP